MYVGLDVTCIQCDTDSLCYCVDLVIVMRSSGENKLFYNIFGSDALLYVTKLSSLKNK